MTQMQLKKKKSQQNSCTVYRHWPDFLLHAYGLKKKKKQMAWMTKQRRNTKCSNFTTQMAGDPLSISWIWGMPSISSSILFQGYPRQPEHLEQFFYRPSNASYFKTSMWKVLRLHGRSLEFILLCCGVWAIEGSVLEKPVCFIGNCK